MIISIFYLKIPLRLRGKYQFSNKMMSPSTITLDFLSHFEIHGVSDED